MWQNLKTQFQTQVWNNEQTVKLRQKFGELDNSTQSYVVIGTVSAVTLLLLVSFFTLWGRSIAMKNELANMEDTIRYLQTSSSKIQDYQEQASSESSDPLLEGFDAEAPLPALVEQAGIKALIAKPNITVNNASGNKADVKYNKISLTQLVRVLYLLEQSGAGTVVDHLAVDTKENPEGYLWATLTVHRDGGVLSPVAPGGPGNPPGKGLPPAPSVKGKKS